MATELVHPKVTAIDAVSGTPAGLAAKAATTTIPIVFVVGGDPIAHGLVTSFNRPTGNITGASFFNAALAAKGSSCWVSLCPRRCRRTDELQ
jgi:putative ABC transport system substrate-binding protein